jgi:hypothetical protein
MKVFDSVQIKNPDLEHHGRAGKVFATSDTHPVPKDGETPADPDRLQVEAGTVAVVLDGDTEPMAFEVADVRAL